MLVKAARGSPESDGGSCPNDQVTPMIVERRPRGDDMVFAMLSGGADHVHDTDALSKLPD